MNRPWFVHALFLALLLPGTAWAENTCPAAAPPEVIVKLDAISPHEDTSLNAREIDALYRKGTPLPNAPDLKKSGRRIGLTVSSYKGAISMKLAGTYAPRKDVYCLAARKVTYTILYRPTVYIASDILKIPCRYDVTVAHEKHHQQIFLDTAEDYLPRIKQDIEDFFAESGAVGPVSKKGLERRKKEIMEELKAYLEPTIQAFKEADRKGQHELDTPENYAREDRLCRKGGAKPVPYNR